MAICLRASQSTCMPYRLISPSHAKTRRPHHTWNSTRRRLVPTSHQRISTHKPALTSSPRSPYPAPLTSLHAQDTTCEALTSCTARSLARSAAGPTAGVLRRVRGCRASCQLRCDIVLQRYRRVALRLWGAAREQTAARQATSRQPASQTDKTALQPPHPLCPPSGSRVPNRAARTHDGAGARSRMPPSSL